MAAQSKNAARFLSHPRRDPVEARVFAEGTPYVHVGRTLSRCPGCRRESVHDLYSATPRTRMHGVPHGLHGQLPLNPAEAASVWSLCAECGAHEVHRQRLRA